MSSSDSLLYEQIADTLRKRILSGTYPVKTRLPSEQALASEFKVSRPTIKNAIRVLGKESLIRTRPAVGSFVIRERPDRIQVGYIAPSLSDPFHGYMVEQLDTRLQRMGGSLIVAGGGRTIYTLEKSVNRLRKSGVSGLLISTDPTINCRRIERLKIPVVWCGGTPDSPETDRVTIDNASGICDLMDHVRSAGAASFGYAQPCNRGMGDDLRSRAFLKYIKTHNLITKKKWQIRSRREGEQSGREILRRFLRCTSMPDTIICCNDWTAMGVVREALEQGIAIPGDLMVTGFDNLLISSYLQIPLTTVDYRIPELAATALTLLQSRLKDPKREPESVLLKGKLVVRQSTKG